MSTESSLLTVIDYCGVSYDKKGKLKNDIEELTKDIENAKSELKSLAFITEPKKFISEDDDYYFSTCLWLENKVNSCIEQLTTSTIKLYKLQLLYDNWDKCHDEKGNAISPDYEELEKICFYTGDWIETIKPSNDIIFTKNND